MTILNCKHFCQMSFLLIKLKEIENRRGKEEKEIFMHNVENKR